VQGAAGSAASSAASSSGAPSSTSFACSFTSSSVHHTPWPLSHFALGVVRPLALQLAQVVAPFAGHQQQKLPSDSTGASSSFVALLGVSAIWSQAAGLLFLFRHFTAQSVRSWQLSVPSQPQPQ